jgi:ABC-type glycerol-3-phosphate transport system permease component
MADIAGTSTSKAGRIASRTGTYVLLIVVAFVCIVPFYVMMVNATRTNQEINRGPSIMPGTALVENWQTLIQGRIDPNTGLRSGGLDVPGASSTPLS